VKHNQLICFIAGITLAICSCKKVNNSSPQTEGQIFLTKFIGFNLFYSSVSPVVTMNYYYDSLDRLQSMVTYLSSPPGGALITYPDSLIYYYYAADTLPFKAVHYNRGSFAPSENYTYDGQTRIIRRDYIRPGYQSIQEDYVYLPNQIIISNSASAIIDTLLYDGTNITKDGRRFNIQVSGVQNPFNLVPINRHIPYNLAWINRGERYLSKNAPLQVIDNFYPQTQLYQYDSLINGFPGKATTTVNSLPDSRLYFYYRQ
jgi:hypothetical protein